MLLIKNIKKCLSYLFPDNKYDEGTWQSKKIDLKGVNRKIQIPIGGIIELVDSDYNIETGVSLGFKIADKIIVHDQVLVILTSRSFFNPLIAQNPNSLLIFVQNTEEAINRALFCAKQPNIGVIVLDGLNMLHANYNLHGPTACFLRPLAEEAARTQTTIFAIHRKIFSSGNCLYGEPIAMRICPDLKVDAKKGSFHYQVESPFESEKPSESFSFFAQ